MPLPVVCEGEAVWPRAHYSRFRGAKNTDECPPKSDWYLKNQWNDGRWQTMRWPRRRECLRDEVRAGWTAVLTFTPKSDQFQISPAASLEILHHTVWRTWLCIAYSDEIWLYYTNSHCLTHSSLKSWGNVLFELGSERVKKLLIEIMTIARSTNAISWCDADSLSGYIVRLTARSCHPAAWFCPLSAVEKDVFVRHWDPTELCSSARG